MAAKKSEPIKTTGRVNVGELLHKITNNGDKKIKTVKKKPRPPASKKIKKGNKDTG